MSYFSRSSTIARGLLLGAGPLLASLMLAGCAPARPAPHITAGRIDLSDYDFAAREPLPLQGDWDFFWEAPAVDAPDEPRRIQVPGVWNGALERAEWSAAHGWATYRIRLQLPATGPPLALYIPPLTGPWRASLDDRLLAEHGGFERSPATAETPTPGRKLWLGRVAGPVELKFELANFHNVTGGLIRSPLLGAHDRVRQELNHEQAVTIFLAGSFVVIGLYHLSLYQLRPVDRSPLYFGLICFLWTLRILVTGQRLLATEFLAIPFEWNAKLAFWTFTLGMPTFCLYVQALYPRHFSRRLARLVVGAGIVFTLLVLFTDNAFFSHLQIPFEVSVLPVIAYFFAVIFRAHKTDRPGTFIFFFGMLVFAATILNDIANNHGMLNTPDLAPVGLYFFLFSQAYLISLRSAGAFKRKEELTANLEQLAADRHRDLQQALGDLRRKDALLQLELDIAAEIQTGSQPEVPARLGDYYVTAYSRSVGKVGGDFFELLELSGDRLGVLIADVSGHGIPGALVANMARMSFREEARRRVSPRSIFEHVNSSMSRLIATPEYITAFLIVLAPDGKTQFSNAAHRHPAVLRRTGAVEYLRADGLLLGAFNTAENSYEEGRLRLEVGDRIVLFTDGLLDAFMDEDPDEWETNFTAFLSAEPERDTDRLREDLIEFLDRTEKSKHLNDDITFMIVERLKPR